jgi:hypothetical protein
VRDWLAVGRGEALAADFGLRLANLTVDIADVSLEFANSLPDRRSDLRDPARAKQHEHDDQKHQHLGKSKVSEIHILLLEKRTRDQISDQDTDEAQQRNIEGDRPYSELEDYEVNVQWPQLGCNSRRQEFLDGARWEKSPSDLREQAADYESYTEDQGMKPRTMLRGSTRGTNH